MIDTIESLRAELQQAIAERDEARRQRNEYARALSPAERNAIQRGVTLGCSCEPGTAGGACFWELLYRGADQSHQAFLDGVRSALAKADAP